MHRHSTYDSWNLESDAALPRRTHFYHMQPLGVGSIFVESLTGYIARLAEAHDVSVVMLWNRELLPRIACLAELAVPPKNFTFIYRAHVLNGAGETAQNCVTVLQNLTAAQKLNATSLARFADVFSIQDCLRPWHAWCSQCFEDWRCSGTPIYEPLLWNIDSVSHCPVHKSPLSTQCPHCGRALYVLSARSRPGYCCRCLQWLGQRCMRQVPELKPDDAALVFAKCVGELLAVGVEPCSFSGILFKTNLRSCIRSLTDGSVNRFCAVTGIS